MRKTRTRPKRAGFLLEPLSGLSFMDSLESERLWPQSHKTALQNMKLPRAISSSTSELGTPSIRLSTVLLRRHRDSTSFSPNLPFSNKSSADSRRKAGPSTSQDRSLANDPAALGMTGRGGRMRHG